MKLNTSNEYKTTWKLSRNINKSNVIENISEKNIYIVVTFQILYINIEVAYY